MTRTGRSVAGTTHPRWCTPERCGHLVPPVLPHMARRHRGPMHRVGETRASGLVMTYLISAATPMAPLVTVHVAGRAGNAWAELSLPQAAALAEQLRELLTHAAEQNDADEDRAGQDDAGRLGDGDE
ncbi:hypothetical protein ACIG87_06410 [Micromonospora sp. NPDC051925]|uniref:hypothetical protein n=1 Tax=Micromonospora sp. NPDC051925 TaxID=3364288 RepID=UPI0037CC0C49